MDQQTDRNAFLCETYRFRNWTTLVVALCFGLAGAYAVCWGFGAIYFGGVRQQRLDAVVCGLFAIGVGSALLFVTYRALTSWLADHKITTCIDEHGIHIGDMLYPYGLVCWIGGRRPFPFSPKVELVFGCDNYREVCLIIPRNKLTCMAEFHQLMQELSTTVGQEHPEMSIGDIGSGMKAMSPAFPTSNEAGPHCD